MTEKLTFENGNVYEGETANGESSGRMIPHGKGKFVFSYGEVYEGDFVKGKANGKGKFTTRESVYEGDFKDGVKHGKGTYTDNGCTFEGEFVEGMPTKGKTTYKDGAVKNGKCKVIIPYCSEILPKEISKDYKPTQEDEWIRLRYEICP